MREQIRKTTRPFTVALVALDCEPTVEMDTAVMAYRRFEADQRSYYYLFMGMLRWSK
jgi:hypothetical protein